MKAKNRFSKESIGRMYSDLYSSLKEAPRKAAHIGKKGYIAAASAAAISTATMQDAYAQIFPRIPVPSFDYAGPSVPEIVGYVIAGIVGLAALKSSLFTIEQQNVGIIQRLGKYKRIAGPGLNAKVPFIEKVANKVSTRIKQLEVTAETITSDKVSVTVEVPVQYQVEENEADVKNSFYKLANPDSQIKSYVFDSVRAKVPGMTLDDVFQKKSDIAEEVKRNLTEDMKKYGYTIVNVLVTNVDPDKNVKIAMNEINTQERMKTANTFRGEAEKVLVVKNAEAQKDRMKLHGEGVAAERMAIIEGYKSSVENLKKAVPDAKGTDMMNIVLQTNYMDMLRAIGTNNNAKVIMVPYSLNSLDDVARQIQSSIMIAQETSTPSKEIKKDNKEIEEQALENQEQS